MQTFIHYFMIEAAPKCDNPEIEKYKGAIVNCWVKAATEKYALSKVKKYIDEENWIYIRTEDSFIAERDRYLDIPEALECYDMACEDGIGAAFYTWSWDSDDDETTDIKN